MHYDVKAFAPDSIASDDRRVKAFLCDTCKFPRCSGKCNKQTSTMDARREQHAVIKQQQARMGGMKAAEEPGFYASTVVRAVRT